MDPERGLHRRLTSPARGAWMSGRRRRDADVIDAARADAGEHPGLPGPAAQRHGARSALLRRCGARIDRPTHSCTYNGARSDRSRPRRATDSSGFPTSEPATAAIARPLVRVRRRRYGGSVAQPPESRRRRAAPRSAAPAARLGAARVRRISVPRDPSGPRRGPSARRRPRASAPRRAAPAAPASRNAAGPGDRSGGAEQGGRRRARNGAVGQVFAPRIGFSSSISAVAPSSRGRVSPRQPRRQRGLQDVERLEPTAAACCPSQPWCAGRNYGSGFAPTLDITTKRRAPRVRARASSARVDVDTRNACGEPARVSWPEAARRDVAARALRLRLEPLEPARCGSRFADARARATARDRGHTLISGAPSSTSSTWPPARPLAPASGAILASRSAIAAPRSAVLSYGELRSAVAPRQGIPEPIVAYTLDLTATLTGALRRRGLQAPWRSTA